MRNIKYNKNINYDKNIFKYKLYLLFSFIIIIYCVKGDSLETYYQYYQSINIYPNNLIESKSVENYVKEENFIINNFFNLTDTNIIFAFEIWY